MRELRPPPMTLWGRRSGGFLKEPVYWCRKEWTLWADGGRPFLTMGSAGKKHYHHITVDSRSASAHILIQVHSMVHIFGWPLHTCLWPKNCYHHFSFISSTLKASLTVKTLPFSRAFCYIWSGAATIFNLNNLTFKVVSGMIFTTYCVDISILIWALPSSISNTGNKTCSCSVMLHFMSVTPVIVNKIHELWEEDDDVITYNTHPQPNDSPFQASRFQCILKSTAKM